jgi:hypothetical protein
MAAHDILEITPGDFIRLKKMHPCGSYQWQVLRIGVDFRLKCIGCGHELLMERQEVERRLKGSIIKGNVE